MKKKNTVKRDLPPSSYFGIYLNDKHTYTSSKELAEKTKIWLEKWLKDRI